MSTPSSKQRRAFSVAKQGAIELGGRTGMAEWLGRAFKAAGEKAEGETPAGLELTHGFHSYPARLHPSTTRVLLECFQPKWLLDPFCGSGTVLVEGVHAGCAVVGGDINPLAVRIARAKTWSGTQNERKALGLAATSIAEDAIEAGKESRRAGHKRQPVGDSYRNRQLAGWFPPHVRRELEYLADRIAVVAEGNRDQGDILWVALSSILYKVSYRASDTDDSKVERNIARGNSARLFDARVQALLDGLEELAENRVSGRPRIYEGDARKLGDKGLKDESFDLVLTSPPYGGVYDYARHHALRLAFLDVNPKRFVEQEIGAKRQFEKGYPGALPRWTEDLGLCMAEMERVAKKDAHVVVVIGDSVAGGKRVAADDLTTHVAGEGLRLEAWAKQTRPVFSAMEKQVFEGETKYEHILAFRKVG